MTNNVDKGNFSKSLFLLFFEDWNEYWWILYVVDILCHSAQSKENVLCLIQLILLINQTQHETKEIQWIDK